MLHDIHIPVMGICYTADTPVRVAHMGLTSVISLVDDGLLEEYRMAYGERLGVDVGGPQTTRIGRIRAYLDFVAEEVERKFDRIRSLRIARCVGAGAQPRSGVASAADAQPLSGMANAAGSLNDKDRYFLMLPAHSPLRAEYEQVCSLSGLRRVAAEVALTEKMECGEIQANIMVSLNHEEAALDAVRGFAASKVKGSLVFSAGVNLGVFEEVAKHKEFYRAGAGAAQACPALDSKANSASTPVAKSLSPDGTAPERFAQNGAAPNSAAPERFAPNSAAPERFAQNGTAPNSAAPAKRIILKVSDFRSAMIQGRYLAKKGMEVYEYRIESGVNCGGHAFVGAKVPMLEVLREFMAKKEELFRATGGVPARITAQGGLCTAEEISQVLALGADGVGVGTPFLLVPQATSCDAETRGLLAAATEEDVRLTHASPLGVLFMNLKTSSAAELVRKKTEHFWAARNSQRSRQENSCGTQQDEISGTQSRDMAPGFPCRQHYLCRNIPGFDHPVCMASREYVLHRLAEIDRLEAEELTAQFTSEAVSPELEAAQPNLAVAIKEKFDSLRRETLERECICRFLGNAGREEIRAKSPSLHYDPEKVAVARGARGARPREPITVCPGPNIAYFNREYTLLEMMQHLYGTGPSLTPADKPSAFELEKKLIDTVLGA